METPTTATLESSPASTAMAPTGEARNEWLRTGKTPEAAPKTETAATSKEHSAEGEKPEGKGAPASEAGKEKQEQRTRSNADTRLNDLLDDLREAGLTPKALKSFKTDYQRTQQQAEPSKTATPEQTAKPASDPKAPVKPKAEDFEGKPWTEYEAAKDQYFEDLADYKATKKLEEHTTKQQQEASARELQGKLTDAKKRYGDAAEGTISTTANTIFNDAKIQGVVKAMVNDSPVLVDLLYVLGSKAEDLEDFLGSARSNPGAAIRKLVLVEKLVLEELAKGGDSAKAEGQQTERGEDGKFTKQQAEAPEKKTTAAPPPPKEVSGRSAAPADEVESAFKSGDARAFIEAENRRDLRKRKGI